MMDYVRLRTDGRGHAILVLGHATAGDLQEAAINRSPENRLHERRVILYSAETYQVRLIVQGPKAE